jgi:hypothetical protein
MSDKIKKTILEVGEIVGTEGLGYAIEDYLSPNNIEDDELSRLWREANNSLFAVKTYLENKLGEEFFEDF